MTSVPPPQAADETKKEVAVISMIDDHPGQERQQDIASFVIEDASKNTPKNPRKEATITVPFLVRKTHSKELVPKPYTSMKQLIIISYCSFLCCLMTGACANHFAWKAQRYREKGLFSESQRQAKYAATLIYVSFGIGIILMIAIPLIVACGFLKMC